MPLLCLLFGLSTVSGTVVVSAAAVVGEALSGSTALATLPVALALVGGTAATLPASHAMARWGRRAGFAAGTAVALAGALLAAAGIAWQSFAVFCAGSLLLGVLGGVSPYYRFTAVEVSAPARQARAIGAVLAGGVVAGVAGPPLAAFAKDLAGPAFAGAYLVMALLAVAILALLPLLRVPPPTRHAKGSGRSLRTIARNPLAAAAVLASALAFGAMVLTMVAAPLSLSHGGHGFGATALVIQAHVVAMFAPAFVTGALVGRFGPARVMAAGLALLAACVLVNLAGTSVAHHWVALVFLGLGWNALFVAGTRLLTTAHTVAETARVQGTNDLLVAAIGAAAALGAGPLQGWLGWQGLNVAVGAAVAVAAVVLALLLARGAPAARPSPAVADAAESARLQGIAPDAAPGTAPGTAPATAPGTAPRAGSGTAPGTIASDAARNALSTGPPAPPS